jgi:basic amino acid/polyamine antiporter, APA family
VRFSAGWLCHNVDMTGTADAAEKQQPTLKRSLSLTLVIFYGLGNIIGAGIYVLLGEVVSYAGMFAPLSFLLASLLACLTAFSYAELVARYPVSAGEAVYVQQGIGLPALSRLVGLLIIMAGIVSAATIIRGFAGYLQVLVSLPDVLVMPLLVLLLGGLSVWGIAESVGVAAVITAIEIAGLLLIIQVAAPGLLQVQPEIADFRPLLQGGMWYGIFAGGFLAFYAFIGFEDMVNVAEEVRQPEVNLPRAILAALLLSTLLYIMVALVAVASVPVEILAGSQAPLAYLYQAVTGREPLLITLISLFAVVNGALIQIIMASRVCYGMGCKRWLPLIFSRVHAVTQTPVVATVSVSTAVLVMALYLPIETLAKSTSYFLLLVFCLVNLSLWRLKTRGEQPAGILCVPRWIPAAGFIASCAFVLLQALFDLRA